MGKTVALQTFAEWRERYHPIASKMLAQDLGVAAPEKAAAPAGPVGRSRVLLAAVAAALAAAYAYRATTTTGR